MVLLVQNCLSVCLSVCLSICQVRELSLKPVLFVGKQFWTSRKRVLVSSRFRTIRPKRGSGPWRTHGGKSGQAPHPLWPPLQRRKREIFGNILNCPASLAECLYSCPLSRRMF